MSYNVLDFYKLSNGEKVGVYIKNDVYLPLRKNEYENVIIDIKYKNDLKYPLKKGTEIGVVNLFIENNLLFSEKIYNIVDIKN